MGAFNVLQSQAPQTLAHALADSPAGLVGWNGQLLAGIDDDFALANIALYWFTGTSGSSIRFYYEMARSTTRPEGSTTVPIALAGSVNDFLSIRRFAERDHQNIVSWNVYEAGSHYTAHTDPGLYVDDVTQFFGRLGSRSVPASVAPGERFARSHAGVRRREPATTGRCSGARPGSCSPVPCSSAESPSGG